MILKGADTFVVTQNQANLLHIVMANFDTDLDNAAELADLLVTSGVQTKQLDRDGKSPLHLAVKKDQVDALIYAADREWSFNTLGRLQRNLLHQAVSKTSLDCFLFLIDFKEDDGRPVFDVFARDSVCDTARQLALINTPFYRILLQVE